MKSAKEIFEENIVWFDKGEVVRHPGLMKNAILVSMEQYAAQFTPTPAQDAARPDYYDTVVNALKELKNYFNRYNEISLADNMYAIAENALKNIEQYTAAGVVKGEDGLEEK